MFTMKAYETMEVELHSFSTWALGGERGHLHTLANLPPAQCPIEQGAGRPQGQSRQLGEEKNHLSPPGIKQTFLSCPAHRPVTILTTISWIPTTAVIRIN